MRTFGRSWSWGLLVLTLVLGCASEEGVAQDAPTKPVAKKPVASKKPGKAPSKKKDAKDKTRYQAKVTDKHVNTGQGDEPFVVKDAVLFVPEVTLFGGGAGEQVKELKLKRGSAEITIPFSKIESLEIGKLSEDRLDLTVKLRGIKKPEDAKLVGTVKAGLELRGKLGDKDLDTIVKLRHAKTIEISPIK